MIIITAIGYTLSPIDLIPEFIFGVFGVVDDVLVVGYGALAIASFFYNLLVERNN